MRYSVLIADDEPLARDNVRALLNRHSDMEVIAECSDGPSTLEHIRERQPDIALLDIRMPGLDGTDLLGQLAGDRPLVVFVTAYDEHAVAAFEGAAMDYVLKPISTERFDEALQRCRERATRDAHAELGQRVRALVGLAAPADPARRAAAAGPYPSRIRVRDGARTYFVPVERIHAVEADGRHVILRAEGGDHRLREPISRVEAALDPTAFVRIHRSHLVRIDAIREVQTYFHGDYMVILQDGRRLRLSRRRKEAIARLVGR